MSWTTIGDKEHQSSWPQTGFSGWRVIANNWAAGCINLCFHPPTDCRLCLWVSPRHWLKLQTVAFGGNSIRTRVRNTARSFSWTHTALPSHLRSPAVIVIVTPCGGSVFEVSHLYCSSSCTAWCSWGCLLMWLFKLFMLVVAKSQLQHLPGAFRKKKER